ncbi:hypothetical protein Leryth_025642 [Lithospermum erythrorhizon]|nr:hypothetical protein Leryth_025642 [Lithospermum erythrorhizon]
MEPTHNESKPALRIGDRLSSDVVVRIRTNDGRDEWIYCHSQVLVGKSKYFSDRLSEHWPTLQILDSRNCVEVYCEECVFDYHVNVLRLLYDISETVVPELCHGVRNALSILRVAIDLGCPQIISACVDYMEAVPWEESEEEEILKIIPRLGSPVERVVARLQPVNSTVVVRLFMSAMRFATSSPPSSVSDLKTSAQEQLDYMLTEDDDAPLVTADEEIKLEVVKCINSLFTRFKEYLESLLCDLEEAIVDSAKLQLFLSFLADLSWACMILVKLESIRDFVCSWVEASHGILKVFEKENPELGKIEAKLKVLEVTVKVLEAIGYGTVILPNVKRLYMVKVWLPFIRTSKPLVDTAVSNYDENEFVLKVDAELWQSLESAIISMILALPSDDQAQVLTEWLADKDIRYPDLTEAFEMWCYRSKVAKRRLAVIDDDHVMPKKV